MKSNMGIILRLDASYKIKHEKYDTFGTSFFKNVYNLASENVREIIETSKTDFNFEEESGYTEPSSNLIAFDGKRGSGKTSAMLSFCDFLSRFNDFRIRETGYICGELLKLNNKISFTVLNCIDATLVTDSKELIGAILGEMLRALKKKESSNPQMGRESNADVRKLRTRLGEIYCSLKDQDTLRDETSPWEVLEQLSRSWNQQQAFRDSVKKFNSFMSEKPDSIRQNYLVIPIDDIDMNLKNGYELLEAVRKYLMAPNVIVLLAADGEQLETICREAFCEGIEKKGDPSLPQKLALEYLEKLIPFGRRVHMPDLYREENLYERQVIVLQENGEEQTVKEIILRNVWRYVGIILNGYNESSHWLQPHSLRKLSNYVNAMHFLSEIGEKEGGNEFFDNIDWFYEDIIKRYFNDEKRQHGATERKAIFDEFDITINKFENAMLVNKLQILGEGLQNYDLALGMNKSKVKSIYSYGDLLTMLFQMRESKFPQILQTTSFILSLQMRRLIYSFEHIEYENRVENGNKEILDFSKNDFWGNIEQIWLTDVGKSRLIFQSICEIPVKALVENESMENLLILAMQLDMKEGRKAVRTDRGIEKQESICVGSLRFGNFVNGVFDYRNKIRRIIKLIRHYGELTTEKETELERFGEKLIMEFSTWEKTYNTSRVIPFDSAEFMLYIFDKLYGDGGVFYSFDTEKQYADMYIKAFEKIGEILGRYDEYFKEMREKYQSGKNAVVYDWTRKYREVYENCPFVNCILRQENGRNIIIKYLKLFSGTERIKVNLGAPRKNIILNENKTNSVKKMDRDSIRD